jgi:predicted GNAT family acetyltransferase
MSTEVVHQADRSRYVIFLDGEEVGEASYTPKGDRWVFDHTFVNPAHQGKNLAAILVREAFVDVRENQHVLIEPTCSYVVRYMEKHPDTHDLLAIPIEDAIAFCKLPPRN